MPSRPLTASAATLTQILEQAESMAPGARAELTGGHLAGTDLADADARVEAHLVPALLEAAARHTSDRAFGLRLALRGHPRRYGLLSYVTASAANLGEAMTRAARYLALWNEGNELRVAADGEEVAVEVRPRGCCAQASPEGLRQLAELSCASCLLLSRALTGTALQPRRVELPGAAGPDADLYRRVFGVAPRFEMPVARLVFAAADLRLPLVAADGHSRHASSNRS